MHSLLTFSDDLFHTITLCPLLRRFLTIPDPMMPRPRNPNFNPEGSIFLSFKVWLTLPTSKGGVSYNKTKSKNKQSEITVHDTLKDMTESWRENELSF